MEFFKKLKNGPSLDSDNIFKTNTIQERLYFSNKLLSKYPNCVPVILKNKTNEHFRYLIPKKLNMSDILVIIRKKIDMGPNQAVFIFVNNSLIPMNSTLEEVYTQHKSEDNFLYMIYTTENTFG
jgi:GABA(A) receptor-associated protein